MIIDGFNYWRYNMRHGYCEKIRHKIDNIDHYYENIKTEALTKAENISNQIIRNKYYDLKTTIFMAFKNQWIKAKQNFKKVKPLQEKIEYRRITDAMRNWKWLRYYKKTKRAYLKHKQLINKRSLKSDVFNCLKIHRIELYNFFDVIQNLIINCKHQFLRFGMHKITNTASQQKNQLIHERRRILHTLIMNKITKQRIIKRKLMWKWQSNLIDRTHYLPNILKSIQLRILKSSFAVINEKKYWNQFYVKQIAQKVTTQGYSDVNSVTNILVKEGFDPDQLKGYLEQKNNKDINIITSVIGHIRTFPKKQQMVKAFHSWKEFVMIKKNIKRVLSKVFNFTSGLGRYFNKWRKKDPHFNQILVKQSRVNMLQRYKQLDRLMKQYRRDIKDSLQNCQQLKQINDEHSKSTHLTVQMAFSNLTNSINKGIKQGFQIWRINAKKQRSQQLNSRYDELVDGIEILDQRKNKIKQRITKWKNQNRQLKQKCKYGQQCGQLLKQLMSEKDGLTVDLAEKQHNLKILLEDNLRLKQKIKVAKDNALKLINKIQSQSAQ